MINKFSILKSQNEKIDWMAQYLTKKKILVQASSQQTLRRKYYFKPHPWFQVKNIY
jgi:hypothetical protein